jgi:hypothetical protein
MQVRRETNLSTAADSDRVRRLVVGLLAILAVGAVWAASASAEFTHPYEGSVTLAAGTGPQPSGVDPEGNIIVFLEGQEVIAKFDPEGNPVNFSALGTNIIDGAGGLECPSVPTDCDRVPAGELGPFIFGKPLVQVDSSGGPTNGYIYLRNHNKDTRTGEICVFAPSGRFLGVINDAQSLPIAHPDIPPSSISIAPNGSLYMQRENQDALGSAGPGGGQIDQYAPVDGNPAHDVFVGQLRFAFQYPVAEVNFPPNMVIGAGENGAFVHGGDGGKALGLGAWRWYSLNEFQKPDRVYSLAKDYMPFDKDQDNFGYDRGAVNGNNGWIYLLGGNGIAIYDTDAHHKIGPAIATEGQIASGANTFAFDDSGGPDTGSFYVKAGETTLAKFGPPVVIPDITATEPDAGHHSAVVRADIGLAGGPNVTECVIEYGLTTGYGSEEPCSPAPEYSSDAEVSAELPGLFTEADYHYRIKAANSNGWNHTFDNIVHTVAVLKLTTGQASNLTPNSATLSGSLDADGMDTTYHFQYGLDTKYDLETETLDAESASGETPVEPVDIDKLQPGRTYHYRLVADNELGTTYGKDRTFTAPRSPLISSLNPTNVLATSADLNARINNFDSDAEYFFRYGTSNSYGQTSPVEQLAASPTPQPIAVHLTGLEPGHTYHFRLVASNEWGASETDDATFDFSPPNCPNSHVRQQVGANYLPDCRAYELVSPSRAGSIQLFPGDFFYRLGPTFLTQEDLAPRYRNTGYEQSPARFGFYGGIGGLPGVESPNFIFDHYLATRTDTGWQTHFAGLKGSESGVALRGECSMTQDKCLDFKIDFSLQTGQERKPFPYVWAADGKFLGRWPTNYAVVPGADHLTGDDKPSPDFTHYVFSSLDVPFKPGGLESAPGSVYDNAVGPGTIEIASKLSGGEPIPQDAGGPEEFIKIPALSPNADHILMSTVSTGGRVNLYMRVDNSITYDITKGNGVEFIGMSQDGSKVAFASPFALTPEDQDSSKDIYRWDETTDTVTLISQGNEQGNSDSCNASWTGGCDVQLLNTERKDTDDRISAEGDIYFFSPEQLDPVDPGVKNQRNLYHLRNGRVQYVTTLDPGTTIQRMQIAADGQHAAFVTRAILTGYDNHYYETFGFLRQAAEMYVFDASKREIQCASCYPDGRPPTILRLDPPANEKGTYSADVLASNGGRFMTDDGRVAFSTAEALSPRDSNGKVDTYEFVGGRPQLISAGTGDRDILPKIAFLYPGQVVGLENFSRDGTDLYFSTYDVLVPQDQNGPFVKFYDARSGGGFAVQGELLPCEAADECHGETSPPVPNPQVGTGTPYTVPGNASQPAGKRKAKKRKKRAHRRRHRRRHDRRARRHAKRHHAKRLHARGSRAHG